MDATWDHAECMCSNDNRCRYHEALDALAAAEHETAIFDDLLEQMSDQLKQAMAQTVAARSRAEAATARAAGLERELARQKPVIGAALAWVDEIASWAEDVSETDEALMNAVAEYRLGLAALAGWVAAPERAR